MRFAVPSLATLALAIGAAIAAPPPAFAASAAAVPASSANPFTTAVPDVTASGIALDAPWKKTIYAMVRAKFVHPAWGLAHSERNYILGMQLASGDGLTVDRDVLFAACFLHDLGAFDPQMDAKMEHGDYAALQSQAILRAAGFPMQKYPGVAAAERAHMFYRDPGTAPESIVLHDADSLDFLGDIGAARMLALTGEKAPSFAGALKSLRSFLKEIPPKLVTKTAQHIGAMRAAELKTFLDAVDTELAVQPAP